jgi:hypothetical protein
MSQRVTVTNDTADMPDSSGPITTSNVELAVNHDDPDMDAATDEALEQSVPVSSYKSGQKSATVTNDADPPPDDASHPG